MKKVLIVSFWLLVVGLFIPSNIFAQNLLQNSDFENGIDNWEYTPQTATFSAVPNWKHGGEYGAKITKEGAAGWAYFSQKVAIEADTYYQLSGYGLINDGSINNIKLRFYWYDASNNKIGDSIEIEVTNQSPDFQFLQTDYIISPSNAQFADIQGYVYLKEKNPVNPAVFDDLVFEEVPPPTPTPTPTDEPEPTSSPVPTSTPIPTATTKPTPTPTKKLTPTPTLINQIATESGEILGATESAIYPLESSPSPTNQTTSTNKLKNKLGAIIIMAGGLLLIFSAGLGIWYNKIR